MKYIYSLLALLFLFTACGTEKNKIEQDPAYDYVEIPECTIPVLKKLNIKYTKGDGGAGISSFIENGGKKIRTCSVGISRSLPNMEDKYTEEKESLEQWKDAEIIFIKNTDEFKVIGWKSLKTHYPNQYIKYELFGTNTMIALAESGNELKQKKDLDYLLEYCKKTRKLNKGENNASTAK